MTEITEDLHEQIKFEQYKIAVVDIFELKCPYCGNMVRTFHIHNNCCDCCNQCFLLFSEEEGAEKYLNARQIRRTDLED